MIRNGKRERILRVPPLLRGTATSALLALSALSQTTFTTYLGTYASPPTTVNYTTASIVLPMRGFIPGGASQISSLTAFVQNAATGAYDFEFVVAPPAAQGSGYEFVAFDYTHALVPYPALQLNADGATHTLATPLTVGPNANGIQVQVTAYRFALAGSEMQMDLSLTLAAGYLNETIYLQAFDSATNQYSTSSGLATWTDGATPFTTYLGTYASPPTTVNYTTASIILPMRCFIPGGVSQISSLTAFVQNAATGAYDFEFVVVAPPAASGGSYQFVAYDWTHALVPYPALQLNADGATHTLATPIAVGPNANGIQVQVTAYRFALAGNEMQMDLSLTLAAGSLDETIYLQAFDSATAQYVGAGVTLANWIDGLTLKPIVPLYQSRGVGGGGYQYGMSFQPSSALAFIATDEYSVFRSIDHGVTWNTIDQGQLSSDSGGADTPSYAGFTANPNIVFWVNNWDTQRTSGYLNATAYISADQGITWLPMTTTGTPARFPLMVDASGQTVETVLYWTTDFTDSASALCATSMGLLWTHDSGSTWHRAMGISGSAQGTFVDTYGGATTIYHAIAGTVYKSTDRGATFQQYFAGPSPSNPLRLFAGGHDANGLTFAYLDSDATDACAWFANYTTAPPSQANCGWVWISRNSTAPSATPTFNKTSMFGGAYLKMADNDSQTLYTVGDITWSGAGFLADAVFVTHTASQLSPTSTSGWEICFSQAMFLNITLPATWPRAQNLPTSVSSNPSNIGLNSIGLDNPLGWDDTNGFHTFSINQRNSAEAGGAGYAYSYATHDSGATWVTPFTQFADTLPETSGKKWKSTGLEVLSAKRIQFHPSNPQLGYVGASDVGGLVTHDGGNTFTDCGGPLNTINDFSFDPADQSVVYAAASRAHDYPVENAGPLAPGTFTSGIYKMTNYCATPNMPLPHTNGQQEFLSVRYNPINGVIYAGTWGGGIEFSSDAGTTWNTLNNGLPPISATSAVIVNQLEVDPQNGAVYALVAGPMAVDPNDPDCSQAHCPIQPEGQSGIYFLDVPSNSTTWQFLGPTTTIMPAYPSYPIRLAINWNSANSPSPSPPHIRRTLYYVDSDFLAQEVGSCPGICSGNSGAWKSTNYGASGSWTRITNSGVLAGVPFSPSSIDLDTNTTPERIYVTGKTNGGTVAYYSDDGSTWIDNSPNVAHNINLWSVTPDPNYPLNIFYGTHGSTLLYGLKPPLRP